MRGSDSFAAVPQVRKACVVKALRPDRLPEALAEVVESVLGKDFLSAARG